MRDAADTYESMLLDLHLKRLDASQVSEVEEAVAGSAQLAAESRAIREVLSLLDRYEAPAAPPNLPDRVIARIAEQTAVIPFPAEAASAVPSGTAHDLSASPVLSLRELLAIAACITLFVGIFVPGYFKAQAIARRNLCINNLRQIGAAMSGYAEENDGFVSYAGFVPNGSWLPSRVPNVQRFSNTRPLFNLLRTGHAREARIFICPSTPHARPMIADDYRDFRDFAEPANISYSFQYMNLPKGRRLRKMDTRMVLLADRNPFFDTRAAHRLNPYDGDTANSLSHEEGAGQSVLYADGSGSWCGEPTVGVSSDNIYRAGQLVRYQGTEQPTCLTDTFLVN